jgi:hypothetical protein
MIIPSGHELSRARLCNANVNAIVLTRLRPDRNYERPTIYCGSHNVPL